MTEKTQAQTDCFHFSNSCNFIDMERLKRILEYLNDEHLLSPEGKAMKKEFDKLYS